MNRSARARVDDVRRLLAAARDVARDAERWAAPLVASTGLSREGVLLGLREHLETSATDAELARLVEAAGDAPVVHVILSANVFVAPLRALALARAAAERVVVRPSRREPVFARALVEAAGDPAITLVDDLDVPAVAEGELHVYGRDETIADVRARARPSVRVRGHGAGFGVAWVGAADELEEAAARLARDVVAFDQRGCLSPRIALVDARGAAGNARRDAAFAEALDRALAALGRDVPRGTLDPDERAAAARWAAALDFAGHVYRGDAHVVGLAPEGAPLALPPPGRHVHVAAVREPADAASLLAPYARYVVTVGGADFPSVPGLEHARRAPLGAMQRPPLDGPVDRR